VEPRTQAFAGRAAELGTLEQALAAARAGRGAAILVAGEAGIGKTRLAAEVTGRAREAGSQTLLGRSIDLVGTELPYQPFADALHSIGGPRPAASSAGSQLQVFEETLALLTRHAAAAPVLLVLEAFFQKHVTAHRPDWIRTATVESDSSRARGTTVTYLVVDDLPALIWAANLAGLELHVPMWRVPHVREPDLLVFDLDPGAPANVVDCCRVAEALRPMLEADGLTPLAKTSGGKGLQLYAAISGVTSDEASNQARAYAERLEREQPRLAVSRMTRSLRTGKVLIDWSQNNGSKTTVAPYSLRARQFPNRLHPRHLGRGRSLPPAPGPVFHRRRHPHPRNRPRRPLRPLAPLVTHRPPRNPRHHKTHSYHKLQPRWPRAGPLVTQEPGPRGGGHRFGLLQTLQAVGLAWAAR
jgi:DNA ligase D-like protein (predicted polymerase)